MGYYGGLAKLWASIHLAGGFAFAPIEKSDKALLTGQVETNLVSAYLCCRAAVNAFRSSGSGGRIVNVAGRPPLEPRQGASKKAYTRAEGGGAALTVAPGGGAAKERLLGN